MWDKLEGTLFEELGAWHCHTLRNMRSSIGLRSVSPPEQSLLVDEKCREEKGVLRDSGGMKGKKVAGGVISKTTRGARLKV